MLGWTQKLFVFVKFSRARQGVKLCIPLYESIKYKYIWWYVDYELRLLKVKLIAVCMHIKLGLAKSKICIVVIPVFFLKIMFLKLSGGKNHFVTHILEMFYFNSICLVIIRSQNQKSYLVLS